MSNFSWSSNLAILVAAVVAWLIGALWYSPVMFAKAWVNAHGYTPEQVAAMRVTQGKVIASILVAMILMAAVLQIFLNHLGATSLRTGMGWAFHAWLGFALPLGFIAHLYSHKRITAWLIDLGYQLVYLVVMGAILGAWH
jgi:Protein of unknown function (DUF1761)